MGRGQDREPLLVGREELTELPLRAPRWIRASLRRDQVDLPLEGVHRRVLERPPRQERAREHRDDQRDEHRPCDPEEKARTESHGTSL